MLVWSCFVPFDVRLEIVRGKAEVIPAGYEWYTRFFTLKPLLRVVFGLLYYILTLALLVSYYKRARGKDTLVRGPAGWVIFLVGVSIAALIGPAYVHTTEPVLLFPLDGSRVLRHRPPTRFAIVPCHTAGILPLRLAP